MVHRQVVYRLLPQTRGRWRRLERLLEAQRQLYNAALGERIDCWRKAGRSVSRQDQFRSLTVCRREPPRGRAGRAAGADMIARLQRLGIRARIVCRPEGIGPTDALAASWAERAAMLQYENGMDRRDAEVAAWNDCPAPATWARANR